MKNAHGRVMSAHTKGPWYWKVSEKSNVSAMLCTERRGCVFVMGFKRHGMRGAEPMFQQHQPECDGRCSGCGFMIPVSQLIKGKGDHNGDVDLLHPDALLIAAAPDLLEALLFLREAGDGSMHDEAVAAADAAIQKARGES